MLRNKLLSSLIAISTLVNGCALAANADTSTTTTTTITIPATMTTTTTTTTLPPHHIIRPHSLVTPLVMRLTMNVQRCEEGHWGWHINGSKYQGGLGWLHATWLNWRRADFPMNMALATPQQQAWAMLRFVNGLLHGWWPDNPSCTGGY